MSKRKTVVAICALCALAISAVAVQSAAAATVQKAGTTAFTCKEVAAGTGHFKGAHCKPSDAGTGTGANWDHVAFAQDTTTELTGSNETTGGATEVVKLQSTQAGIAEEIQAEVVSGTGWMKNQFDERVNGADVEDEHYVHGEGTIEYSTITVTKPAGKGCKVKGNKVTTKPLTATTTQQEDFLKFTPASGSVFAEFEIESCTGSSAIESLNGLYKVEGSVKGVPNGATTNFTHTETTAQGTLKLRGQKAGIEGPLTIKGRDNSLESYTPLSATTVTTP
jgi:hypothetical protein